MIVGVFEPGSDLPGEGLLQRLGQPSSSRLATAEQVGRTLTAPGLAVVNDGNAPSSRTVVLEGHRDAALAFEGHLDNRVELTSTLGLGPATSIGTVLSRAWRRWGPDMVAELEGVFALMLWDAAEDQLILARDALGLMPLYVHASCERVRFATRLEHLVDNLRADAALDEAYIASYLTRPRSDERTPFRAVRAVRAAHLWIYDRSGEPRTRRYWSPAAQEISGLSDAAFEEGFREHFSLAVRRCLPRSGTVLADLSGGLDSSSIVCVADDLIAHELPELRLETLSWIYDRSTHSDERRFIRKVEARRGRQGHHLAESAHPLELAEAPEDRTPAMPTPVAFWDRRYQAMVELAARRGAGVLLRGLGGDQAFFGEAPAPLELADLAARGAWFSMLPVARTWAQLSGTPIVSTLWQGGIVPTLPRGLRRQLATDASLPRWIAPDFARELDFQDRLLGPERLPLARPSSREQWTFVEEIAAWVTMAPSYASHRLEMRYPFLDRGLLEFALALPMRQKLRPGETRSILRRALRGVLPPEIANRHSKAGPGESVLRAIRRQRPFFRRLLHGSRVVDRGWVRGEQLGIALDQAAYGRNVDTIALLKVFALEHWLRRREGALPSAASRSDWQAA